LTFFLATLDIYLLSLYSALAGLRLS
jgi:hypothetical protein